MLRRAALWFGPAALLILLRLFTGVVIGADEDTYLILKSLPDPAIEQVVPYESGFSHAAILDADTGDLVYRDAYRWLMQAAPILALVLIWRGVAAASVSQRPREE